MEDPKQWRYEKAKELKSFPDREERRKKLEKIRTTQEYADSKSDTVSEIKPDVFSEPKPLFRREEFDEVRLQMLIRYCVEVLEMYRVYQQSANNHDLYLQLLSRLTQHRGDVGYGKDFKKEESLSPLIKRMGTKAQLAIMADFLDANRLPGGGFKSGSDIYGQLSHGIAKTIMYEKTEDELFRELSLLAAHGYEAKIVSKTDAIHAANMYKCADVLKYKDKIKELEAYSGTSSTTSPEKEGEREQSLFLEAQVIVDKYKKQISLESIMNDLNEIYKIIKSLT